MPQSCNISNCDSISISSCRCCNQYLCRDHFIKHDSILRSKLNDLTEEIDELNYQLDGLNIQKLTDEFVRQLDQWRCHSYQIIDQFYEKKYEEVNHYLKELFNKEKEEIGDLRLKIAKMINVQQTTTNNLKLLTSKVQNLQQQIQEFEHISIQANIDDLVIEENLIDINISNSSQLDLSKLSSPYQIINRIPLSSDAITSNNHYFLIHQNSNLYLIDENFSVIEETKWAYAWIRDMCWSQTLNSFIILTSENIYLVEENTLTIQSIETISERSWQSCTCSETCLYLSKDQWNTSIEEYSLKPSIQLIQHYQSIESKDSKQRIDCIRYDQGKLALLINDQSKQEIFIELRSMINFHRLWFYRIPGDYSERKMQCCLLTLDAWMVADWESSSLFYITKDGTLKSFRKYDFKIQYIHFFGTNQLIISTHNSIHFHQL